MHAIVLTPLTLQSRGSMDMPLEVETSVVIMLLRSQLIFMLPTGGDRKNVISRHWKRTPFSKKESSDVMLSF